MSALSNKDEAKQNKQTPFIQLKTNDLELANKRIEELEFKLKMKTIKNEYLEMLRSLRIQKEIKTKQESSTRSENKKNIH